MAQEETAANLPATEDDLKDLGLPSGVQMATGLQVFFNDRLYNKCARLANVMAKGEGTTPKHLIGKPEACFAVISRSITWNLDPFAVAQATYMTPGGSIGYMGVLVQAILENSGRLIGGLLYTHKGEWSKVKGKFHIEQGQRGGKYPVPDWTPADAKGLQVIVSARVKGESEDRSITIDLDECFPLNSPLWATSPSTQICYLAARRFANLAMPGVMMGVPFDIDPTNFYGEPEMTDVTPPRPARSEFERPAATATTAAEKPQEAREAPTHQGAEVKQAASATPAAAASQASTTVAQVEPTQHAEPVTEQAKASTVQDATVEREPGDDTAEVEPEETIEQMQQRLIENGELQLPQAESVMEVSKIRDEVGKNLSGEALRRWAATCDIASTAALKKAAKKHTPPKGGR